MILLFIFVSVVILSYLIFVKPYQYWKNKNVQQLPTIPLIGNGASLFLKRQTLHEWVRTMYDSTDARYLGVYNYMFPRSLVIRDINLIKQICVKDFDHFTDHNVAIDADSDPMFAKNLFAMKGDDWRHMRAALSPVFTGSKMRAMFNLISACGEQYTNYFLNIVDDQKPYDIEFKDTFTRFANDVIATAAFGIQCNSIENKTNEFYLKGKDATNFGGWRLLKFIGFNISKTLMKMLNIHVFSQEVEHFFLNLIKTTISTREKEGIIRPDMIHLLMEARKGKLKYDNSKHDDAGFATVDESDIGKTIRHTNNIDLSDESIAAQAVLFFIAGFDTISTAMCFMGYELAINEDVQQKLQEEIDDALEQCNGKITYEIVQKMKYLDMVFSETLRKYPPAASLNRQCVEPYVIPPERAGERPVKLDKKDVILIPVQGIHFDPKYYPNPDKFDPERFSDENKKNIDPMAYMPFGVGPRNCIGSRFALMEGKIIFLHLLSKFSFVPTKRSEIPINLKKGEFILNAKNGFWFGLKKRKL